MKNYSVIIRPITTEKSAAAQTLGRYTFWVEKDATKIDVKRSFKDLYGVPAEDVSMMIVHKKERAIRGKYMWAKRPTYKKAIVTVKGKKPVDISKLKEAKKK